MCYSNTICYAWFASLPVAGVTVLDDVGEGVLLVDGAVVMFVGVWSCITVLVGVGEGVLLVDGAVAMFVGVWSCITMLVGVGERVLLVDGAVAVFVGVWSCITVLVGVGDVIVPVAVRPSVDCTVLVLVVLGPTEMWYIHMSRSLAKVSDS